MATQSFPVHPVSASVHLDATLVNDTGHTLSGHEDSKVAPHGHSVGLRSLGQILPCSHRWAEGNSGEQEMNKENVASLQDGAVGPSECSSEGLTSLLALND